MIWIRCGQMRKEQSSPMRISYEWRMYWVSSAKECAYIKWKMTANEHGGEARKG